MNRFVDRAQRGSKRRGVAGALLLALLLVVAACGTAPAATQTPVGMDMDMSTPAGSDLATATAPVAQATSTGEMVLATPTGEMVMGTPETATGDATASPTTQAPESSPTTAAAEASPTAQSAAPEEAEVVEIQATLREWALDVSQTEVAAGKVRFVVGNAGRFPHNFAIRAGDGGQLARTPNFSSGDGAQVVEVELQPGTYVLYCALPGHEQQGQRAELVVR